MNTSVAEKEKRLMHLAIAPDLIDSIQARAIDLKVPLDVYFESVLRSGMEAEETKRQSLFAKLAAFRQASEAEEASRIENEIGVMIFGE